MFEKSNLIPAQAIRNRAPLATSRGTLSAVEIARHLLQVGEPFRQFLMGETPKTGLPHQRSGSWGKPPRPDCLTNAVAWLGNPQDRTASPTQWLGYTGRTRSGYSARTLKANPAGRVAATLRER